MFALIIAILSSLGIYGGSAAAIGSGGGGGGGAVVSVAPPSTDPDSWEVTTAQANVYRTTEYYAGGSAVSDNNDLEKIHAAQTYAVLSKNGLPIAGDGVLVGVVDTGVQLSHSDLIDYGVTSHNYSTVNPAGNGKIEGNGHGTHVAGIIAASKNDSMMHGVAFNSKIVAVKALDDDGTGTLGHLVSGIGFAVTASGVKVVNMSFGSHSYYNYSNTDLTGTPATNPNYGKCSGTCVFDTTYLALVQSFYDTAFADTIAKDVVLAVAAGNDYHVNPDPSSPAIFAAAEIANSPSDKVTSDISGYMIAVASVGASGSISSFSNYCGVTASFCIAAYGEGITSTVSDTNLYSGSGTADNKYAILSGTSMATPQVTGAVAILRAAWPHLTAPQTIQILLTTATKTGIYANTAIYGQGLLDLYSAVQAQGTNSLGYGVTVAEGGYDLRSSSMATDPVFGDAFVRNVDPHLANAVFFDEYGRDYKAFLPDRIIAKNTTYVPTIENISFNNYNTKSLPVSFGNDDSKLELTMQVRSYKNSDDNLAKNRLGTKFLTVDNSVSDIALTAANGFSFAQEFNKSSKVGFAFNRDEITNLNSDKHSDFGFISVNSFAANPYQSFVNSGNNFNASAATSNSGQKNFNQFFARQKFFENKFAVNFSYQTSYQSQSIFSQINNKQNQIADFSLAFLPGHDSNATLSFGELSEFNNNFLNSQTSGAFQGAGNAKTSYVKFSSTKKLFDDVFLISSVSQGYTKLAGNNVGIFRSYSDIRSSASAIGILKDNIFGGKLGFVYSEPLRVYSGNALIDIPVARDIAGNITRYSASVSLKPQGKERDFELYYSKDLAKNSQIKFNLIGQLQPGNIQDAKNNYLGFLSYHKVF